MNPKPNGSVESQGRFYLQGNHKDCHGNSLRGRSRPARSMKGERGTVMLKYRNCAIMDFVGQGRDAGERQEVK